jgi:REP element-mobilizing transposase RayT
VAQSLAQVYLHIVFSTKNRFPFLNEIELRKELHAYLLGICKNMDSPSLQIGGIENHVHILCRFSRKYMIMSLIGELKKGSSKWLWDRTLSGSIFRNLARLLSATKINFDVFKRFGKEPKMVRLDGRLS